MPKSAVNEVTEDDLYPLPKGVVFTGTLASCEQVPVTFKYRQGPKAGQDGGFDKWEWTLVVTGPAEYVNTEVRGTSEPKITNASESSFLPLARPYVEALLGRTLEIGEEIDTDDLLGLSCQFTVRHLEPRPRKNGDGHWFNVEVDEIFPASGAAVPGSTGVPAYDEPPF